MKCPNCGSENVIFEDSLVSAEQPRGFFWWLFIGWWMRPILWLVTRVLGLFGHRVDRQDGENPPSARFVCQNCGYSWLPK